MGTPGSRVIYFTANANGEAEVIKVTLEPGPKIKKIFFDYDFSTLEVKGRGARGNQLSKIPIHKIGLKSHGHSTLGGREIWWDKDVNRLNTDGHGELLGKFHDEESILVVLTSGDFYITTADPNSHFEQNIMRIEKWDERKVWTAVLKDASNSMFGYIKRFEMEAVKNHRNFIGDNGIQDGSQLLLLTDTVYPRVKVTFGGNDSFREPQEIDCEQFIAVKGYKAKGKRISTFEIEGVEELEPTRFPEPVEEPSEEDSEEEENLDPDAGKSQQQVIDELNGQLRIFDDE
jgi:topoisomerase-4 subunit A